MIEKRTERGGLEAYGVGIVVDNRDPERKGRIKLYLGAGGGGASAWLPVLRRHAGDGHGPWTLPDVGTQAAYILTDAERCEGVALGFVRDETRRPPETGTKKASDSKVIQTRKHRIEIIEEDGKEEIRAESAGGKMRAVISRDGGISLVNELGDINIKCRSLRVEGDGLAMRAGGAVKLRTEDSLKVKADGKIAVEGGSEVKVKGKNVRLHGSRGVSAEGKQVAAEGDRVLGFDVHVMTVPSGTGTADVPLPHPFMGRLKDRLAKDVRLGSRKCAVKGSAAKHDDATHMQLPGTIKFQQNPKKEGEVTGGTSAKVKIDGKEAAVIGSTVTTCNDVGARDNSTVMAAGASMPMPTIINPLNTEEWKREREEEKKKEPSFQSAKWAKTTAEEGEEIELTATVRDIADGNTVTLQVFPEGKGPEDGAAYAKLPVTVKDGAASARWSYRADRREMPPEENPRFVFTAHSAWCNFARSGNSLEVKLKRPEITKAEWRDKDGNATGKGLVGEPLKLVAETKDMEGGVTFHVYDENKREVFSKGADIADGRAEAEWTYHWNGEKLEEKPRFIFEVTGNRCKKAKSPEVEIGAKLLIRISDQLYDALEDIEATIHSNDDSFDVKTDAEGKIEREDLTPNSYELEIKLSDEQKQYIFSEVDGLRHKVNLEKENEITLTRDLGAVS